MSEDLKALAASAAERVYEYLDPHMDGWAAGDGPTPESVIEALIALGWRPPNA